MPQKKVLITKPMCGKLAKDLIEDPEDGTGFVDELSNTRKLLAAWLYAWFKKHGP